MNNMMLTNHGFVLLLLCARNSVQDFFDLDENYEAYDESQHLDLPTKYDPVRACEYQYRNTSEVKPFNPSRLDSIPQFKYNVTAICEFVLPVSPLKIRPITDNGGPNTEFEVKSIIFKNSYLSVVPVGMFNNYQELTTLYINNSQVQTLEPGVFAPLKNLVELHLENNYITHITKGLVNNLPNLKKLYLHHNSIIEIETKTFLGLFQLSILDIRYNKLTSVYPDLLNKLANLKEVYLSYNDIAEFNLDSVPKITTFDLSHNHLTMFNFSMFRYPIKVVNLGYNSIESIFSYATIRVDNLDLQFNNITESYVEGHEKYLDFSGNQIGSLTNDSLFNSSVDLQTLDFSNNVIIDISVDVFVGLKNLRHLLLQNNLIDSIPIGCFNNLKNLTTLDLSHNLLSDLTYGTFTGLISLVYLDLSNNKLTEIYSSLHTLTNLRVLNVTSNFLTEIDAKDLLAVSKQLRYISLSNNPWLCNKLANAITTLGRVVVVEEGANKKTFNVHGIGCRKDSENSEFKNDTKASDVSGLLSNVRKYFNEDFLKSEFYKYFEKLKTFDAGQNFTKSYANGIKLLDNVFENTKMYKFFNSDLQQNHPIKKLLNDLTNTVSRVNNNNIVYSTNSAQNTSDSALLKLLNSFDTKLSDTFSKMDAYGDQFFLKFNELVNNNRNHNNNLQETENLVGEKMNAQFAAYTNDRNDNISLYLSKIDEHLQSILDKSTNGNSNIAFFTLITVILFTVLLLMTLNRFRLKKSKFCRSTEVNALENTMHLTDSRIEIV